MPDTAVVADAQAADDDQPSTGTPATPSTGDAQTAQAASAADGSGSDDSETLSLEEARKLRRENASLRKRVADIDKAQADADAARMSDLEKANARIAELERREQELVVREQERGLRLTVESVARRLGFWDPDVAYGLIDRAAVVYEDGAPKNVERLLSDIAKEKPRLIAQAPDFGGGPRGGTARGNDDMNARLRRAAGRTT